MKKIIITGANGFLGRILSEFFIGKGFSVVAIARRLEGCSARARYCEWDGLTLGDWVRELEGAEAIINLAGRTVNCRYTDEHKKEILESRVTTTKLIGDAIKSLTKPPEVWINSSTATIYEHREQGEGVMPHTEAEGVIGEDFSMNVAKAWEKAFYEDEANIRKVSIRTAIVLGVEKGTVFDKLSAITRMGLGGSMGSGKQMVSWLHEEDFCRSIAFIVDHRTVEGAVNLVSPEAETNDDFMRGLRTVWGIPFGIRANEWMLQLGTRIMRTEAELVLKSRWVYPSALLDYGYEFKYSKLILALRDLRERAK